MDDMRDLARDPEHRRSFEKLLYLAAQRGDADLVAERLSWGVDPNCTFGKKTRTPMIANICCSCPSAATVRALLDHGADPTLTDQSGLTALDYARRKLSRLQARPRRRRKSPSLDENNQLRLTPEEQEELDQMRSELGEDSRDFVRIWWQERLRAARRSFNDPEEVEKIVALLEAAGEKR
jgi:ankyrin repeat protein